MSWLDITLIIQGYRHRNALQYQLQRIQAWAAAFCMGNKDHKSPEDLFHLYCDDYLNPDELDTQLTPKDIKQMKEQMKNWNFGIEQKKEGNQ